MQTVTADYVLVMKCSDRSFRLVPVALVLMLAMLQGGCDSAFEPYEDENGLFSIYGSLSLTEEVQYIRVQNMNEPVANDSIGESNATVTLENLSTGASETLADTVFVFDGAPVRNYRVTMALEPESPYRLEATRADGATAWSEITTPAMPDVVVAPTGEDCATPIDLSLGNVSDPSLLRVAVGVDYRFERHWLNLATLEHEGSEAHATIVPDDILYELFYLRGDNNVVVPCNELDDDRLFIRFTHFGPDWSEYLYSPDPLERNNITHGLGFLGALYEEEFAIPVDTTIAFE